MIVVSTRVIILWRIFLTRLYSLMKKILILFLASALLAAVWFVFRPDNTLDEKLLWTSKDFLAGKDILQALDISYYGRDSSIKCTDLDESSPFYDTYDGTYAYIQPKSGGLMFTKPFLMDFNGVVITADPSQLCGYIKEDDSSNFLGRMRLYGDIMIVRVEFSRANPTVDNGIVAFVVSDNPLELTSMTIKDTYNYAIDRERKRLYANLLGKLAIYDIANIYANNVKLLGTYIPDDDWGSGLDSVAFEGTTLTLGHSGYGRNYVKVDAADPQHVKFLDSWSSEKKPWIDVQKIGTDERGHAYVLRYYFGKPAASLVDLGGHDPDTSDDMVVVDNIKTLYTPYAMKILADHVGSHDPQQIYLKNLRFSTDKKEFIAEIGDIFVALDRSSLTFRILKISNTLSPHQWGSFSPDNRYFVSNEKGSDAMNDGWPKELWIHDFSTDLSVKIRTLSEHEIFMSSVELDVGVGEVDTSFEVQWINNHTFEYAIYDSRTDVAASYREFKLLEKHRYDIITGQDVLVARASEAYLTD